MSEYNYGLTNKPYPLPYPLLETIVVTPLSLSHCWKLVLANLTKPYTLHAIMYGVLEQCGCVLWCRKMLGDRGALSYGWQGPELRSRSISL